MRPNSNGFTLVEMLVALSVAALLVSLVYGAVRIGQRSAQAVDRQAESSEIMRIGWQFLHDAITRARSVLDPDDPANRTGFRGTSDRLQFIADIPSWVGIGGMMRIRLGSEATADGEQLVLSRERIDKNPVTQSEGVAERAVLVEHLDRIQISYLGPASAGQTPEWQSDWDHASLLPNLVSVTVTPVHGQAWPVLVARPTTGSAPIQQDARPADDTPPTEPEEVPD